MDPGYVYILINPSFPDLIKIGRTSRDSRTRARELSRTGVPTPFLLASEIFSTEHQQLENALHAELSAFRLNYRREFYRYPLDQAIEKLQELSRGGPSTRSPARARRRRIRSGTPRGSARPRRLR